jgi:hypothetical protein
MFTTLVLLAAQVNPIGSEPPSDRAVLRALPVARGVPFVFEQYRDDMLIVKNYLAERKVTLLLPAGARVTLAVEYWKCVVYYTETIESNVPFPFKASRKRVQVVYLDPAVAK